MSGFARNVNNNNNNNNTITKFATLSGNKRGASTTLTAEEKKKNSNEFFKSLGKFGARGGFNLTFVSLWKVSARDVFFPCYHQKILQGFCMIAKNGKKEREPEALLMLMQTGNTAKLAGVGTRYVDTKLDPSQIAPEYTKPEEYSYQVQLFFPESLPEQVLQHNPTAMEMVNKEKEYMEERSKMALEFALKCPEMSSIKEEAEKSADLQVVQSKKKNPKQSEDSLATQREVAFETAFEGSFKFGVKKEEYQNENNETKEISFIGVKCSAFGDNYKKLPLPTDLSEFENNPQLKPQVDLIKFAHAKGKRLNKMEILNPDKSIREYGTFEIPVKSGSIVLAAVVPKWYDKGGDNRGCGYKCKRMQVVWERGSGGGSDVNATIARESLNFVPGKVRTYYEICLLKFFKQHIDKADGDSAEELVAAFVESNPPVMAMDDLTGNLETLMTDKLVVNVKDDSHFKLASDDLDVEKLPSMPKPNSAVMNINNDAADHNMFDDDD